MDISSVGAKIVPVVQVQEVREISVKEPPVRPVPKTEGNRIEKRGPGPLIKGEERARNQETEPTLTGLDKNQLEKLAESIEEYLQHLDFKIEFSVHEDTDQIIVKVVDPKSGKVIRQIPPEELLKIQEKLHELTGLLFEKKA
ncbi:flagellar protein FlaG [Thermosulfuriphilus ammonigenes]|uniref:Flagellar protein FlaG n=1 Tax=Thermosulfuriphilus ammonigenes TaxID=1936021 RepID=A0A6G7PTI9_9BACT|nr:flagellar protein FlaG [Thermosulfuriphilus ammonigenes]MBA2849262.1 flagellar protein FlaG [Thermosulfuriphilus ammonigenes]QIJ70876.1 flagellar protein FlaG [Thermosulfuriphilus ammonigenes]